MKGLTRSPGVETLWLLHDYVGVSVFLFHYWVTGRSRERRARRVSIVMRKLGRSAVSNGANARVLNFLDTWNLE